jgi:hypothetical protein
MGGGHVKLSERRWRQVYENFEERYLGFLTKTSEPRPVIELVSEGLANISKLC